MNVLIAKFIICNASFGPAGVGTNTPEVIICNFEVGHIMSCVPKCGDIYVVIWCCPNVMGSSRCDGPCTERIAT